MTAEKNMLRKEKERPRIIIIGGGFGGLYAAQNLGRQNVEVLLIDKRNFHLFQPLLYQVATGGLSPGDIASPLRAVVSKYKNIRVVKGEVENIDLARKKVFLENEAYSYDQLIVAAGAQHHYFGNDQWAPKAPGLKTIEDALEMRRRIFQAFENAEKESDPLLRQAWLNFVIIGGGPTGVELAGALAELAYETLKNDFAAMDPSETRITLIEGAPRILGSYPEELSAKAQKTLEKLGVKIKTNSLVIDIDDNQLRVQQGEASETIRAKTILWGAGVKMAGLADILARESGAVQDRTGRIHVTGNLQLENYPEVFVIGDMAYLEDKNGEALPGVAPVAMQQGKYVAKLIRRQSKGKRVKPFRYLNKGSLAVIGRNAAVADFGFARLAGWPAWLVWIFVHIAYLIEYENRLLVLIQWASNYLTRKKGARLITGVLKVDSSREKDVSSAYK